jgi:FkbM family methyltransferase
LLGGYAARIAPRTQNAVNELIRRVARIVLPRPVRSRLRAWRFARSVASYRRRRVRHIYGGIPLVVQLADPVAEAWYDRDWPSLLELEFLRGHSLKPGALVFDLGAHQCVVAMMLAHAVQPGGRVVAVEASRYSAEMGEENRRLNGVANLEVVNAAVAAESGAISFSEASRRVDQGGGSGQEVRAVTIDELAAEHGAPDVVYMDVEGFEWEALRGASRTLGRRPDWFVEVHVSAGLERFGGSADLILRRFTGHGYQLFVAPEGGELAPLQPGSAVLRQRFFLVAVPHAGGKVGPNS